ncbi:MAG: SiaB family protein kinase [Bacteroidales bacterium]|nr:SiaB family protein kinase [Bacteroidales bacterium]
MSFDVHEYYSKLNGGDVLVAFEGSVTTDLINNILEEIEEKMEGADEQAKIRKKVYNVLVESLQNLYHHVEELPENLRSDFEAKFGILVVSRENEAYKISTGNFISSEKIKFLKDKIDKINSLSKDELKDMYKFILNHQKLSAKGGGGLGLVDIARKTGNKLEYTFQHYQDDYYFFNLDVFVSEEN